MGKKFSGVSQTMSRFRGWIQAGATLLTNLHLPNFFKGGLYQGAGKTVCVPGLNCYSCPAELSEQITKEMQGYAEKVAEVLGLNTYSRTDFLLDAEDHIFCLEANTLPGMTPTSLLPQEAKVTGVDFNQLCEKLIESSMRKYKN